MMKVSNVMMTAIGKLIPRYFLIPFLLIAHVEETYFYPLSADQPLVIAHRGASGYRPEHTLASYKLAIEQGADFIELDLVMTKDGILVARHDLFLSGTTDVAVRPEFADKKRVLQGKEDWFVFDFTIDELKKLRTIQPRPARGQQFDGDEPIPTFSEVIQLVMRERRAGSDVGIYVEIKQPNAFKQQIKGYTETVIAELYTLGKHNIPLYFQCFDGNFLLEVGDKIDMPLILLIGGKKDKETGWYKSDIDFGFYLTKVAGFGLNKALVIDKGGSSSGLVEKLRDAGTKVHIWTIRDDAVPNMFKTVQQEYKLLYSMGVDGVFTDFPDTAIKARRTMELLRKSPLYD